MTVEYKERLYKNYYQLHILPRKGPLTQKRLISSAKSFSFHFGEFLPEERESSILDVGCGSGSLIWWLHSKGFKKATGIDLSEDQIEAGKHLKIKNIYCESLVEHIQRCTTKYKLVFLRDVIEHIPSEELLNFLDHVHSVLEPRGMLIIQAPNAVSPFFGRVLYGDFSHEKAFTATSLSQILALTGFDNHIFKPFEPRLHKFELRNFITLSGWKSAFRMLSWSLVKSFYRFLLYAELGEGDLVVTFNIIVCSFRK